MGALTAEDAATLFGSLGLDVMSDCPVGVEELPCYSEKSESVSVHPILRTHVPVAFQLLKKGGFGSTVL